MNMPPSILLFTLTGLAAIPNWCGLLADAGTDSILYKMVVGLSGFVSMIITWLLYKLQSSVDRNSALLASLIEVQIVRMAQAATGEEQKDVVKILREHFEKSKL